MTDAEQPNEGELILYQTQQGAVRIEVLYESETFWLDQKKIAQLFGVDLRTISEHLRNIYASGELTEQATLRKIRRVQKEGSREVRREIEFYNLDAIISVGYRVNSAQATQFRIWATQTLREFVIKGFVLDDERLKLNKRFGKDQAARQIPMRMADWVARLDAFLKFNEYEVLTNAGSVSAEVARQLAEQQFAAFRIQQDRRFESDFRRRSNGLSVRRKRGTPNEAAIRREPAVRA